MRRTSTPQIRWRWWPDVTVLAVGALLVRIPTMFAPTQLGYDDGGYGLAAVAMRQGYAPFREIFSPQGPLFLPLVHVADLVGLEHRNAPRLLSVAAGIVVTVAVYAIGIQTMDRGRALLAGGVAAVGGVLLWTTGPLTGDGPGAAFATSAVAIAVAYRARPSWGRVIAVTVLAGCAVATKSLLVGPALVVAWALVASRRRWAHIVLVPVGALGLVVALAAPWGFDHVLNDYVRYHLDKTADRKPGANLSKLVHTFLRRDPFLVALAALAPLAAAVRAVRVRRSGARRGRPTAPGDAGTGFLWWWAGIAVVVLLLQDPMFRNHLTALAPPTALLAARYRPDWRVVAVAGLVTLPIQAVLLRPLLLPHDYGGTTAEIVDGLRALPHDAWAISDEPGLVWRAGLGTDPNYVDSSVLRIDSDVDAIRITEPRLARAATRRRVCAVVITSDERFGSFPRLPRDLLRLGYDQTVSRGGTSGLYLRPGCRP
ncbi:MAG: ArnT family glycosyltransferase [Acidimicrobiia bacterium]